MSTFPVPGEAIGRFRIQARLGSGGMGVVYDALEENLGRRVALKVISPQFAQDPDFRDRFTSEARALASLDSPHCVTVYAHGEEDGYLYIATQLVPDGDLAQMLQRWGPAPVGKAVELIEQVASGLSDAHAAGLVHRDIKPANILVRRRGSEVQAYLGDFGIARRVDAEVTRVGGAAIGTPSYMAPELHQGGTAGVASDVYSLGCLLWVVLTGAAPYPGVSDYEVVHGHLTKPVPQLAAGLGSGPSGLVALTNRVLARTLAKDPRERYATAQELHDDLRAGARMTGDPAYLQPAVGAAFEQTRVPGAPPPPPPPPPAWAPPSGPPAGAGPGRRRTALWVAAGAAAVLVVGGGAALALAGGGGSDDSGDPGAATSQSGTSGSTGASPDPEEEFLALAPEEIVAAAEKDMRVLDSVRLAGVFTGSGTDGDGGRSELTVTSTGDCAGTFALGGGSAELRALGGTAWIRPDAAFFGAASGDPDVGVLVADRLGDRWLLTDEEETGGFDQFCDLDELLESEGASDDSGDTVEGTIDIRGAEAVEVHSTDAAGQESISWVSVAAPHYVLRIEDDVSGRIDFSDFDEPFQVVPPPSDEVVTIDELAEE